MPPTFVRSRSWAFAVIGVLSMMGAGDIAQEAQLPVQVQVSLFARIWTFDRNHDSRADDGLVIGVVYQSSVRSSLRTKNVFVSATEALPPRDGSVRVIEIDYVDPQALEEAVRSHGIDMLYVAPLRAVDVDQIAVLAGRLKVLTCTGVPQYVSQGLAVGLELSDGRPGIVVNREASRQQGADFGSSLLQLARIVEGTQP
jgi:YfiR/HmsC-like